MNESSKRELVKNQQQLESKIDKTFGGSKTELQNLIEHHSAELEGSNRELQGVSEDT